MRIVICFFLCPGNLFDGAFSTISPLCTGAYTKPIFFGVGGESGQFFVDLPSPPPLSNQSKIVAITTLKASTKLRESFRNTQVDVNRSHQNRLMREFNPNW